MATRNFRYQSFCLSYPDEKEAYILLMQDMKVDNPQNHEILSETGGWTKDGHRMVDVSYIETDPEQGDERF